MVDALIRARRWLVPGGVAIDLRPAHVVPDIELGLSDGTVITVGQPVVGEERRARHRAADRALRTVIECGAYVVENEERFSFFYYPDSPDELRDHLAAKWRDTRIADDTYAGVVTAVRAHPGGRLWLREPVAIRQLRPR